MNLDILNHFFLFFSFSPDESEVTSSNSVQAPEPLLGVSLLCPCEAATRLEQMSEEEAALDTETLAWWEEKMVSLLGVLLGDKRMTGLGYPAIGPFVILQKVLRLTGTNITGEDDLCTDSCKVCNFIILYILSEKYGNMILNGLSLIK